MPSERGDTTYSFDAEHEPARDVGKCEQGRRPRLSIIVEWANTRLNGTSRAWALLDALRAQWQQIVDRAHPETLPAEAMRFIDRLDRRVELIVVSGEALPAGMKDRIVGCLGESFDVDVSIAEGLEYYALKSYGAQRASGDLLLFVDSDVHPDGGWLAHLVGSFGRKDVEIVCAQTYVAPVDLFARAFALGWRYPPRDDAGEMQPLRKFFCNSIAFRTGVFPPAGFPTLGRRTRGAATLIAKDLDRRGIRVWQNGNARVEHPPPSSLRHLAIRAIAEGRDRYMIRSEERNLYGLAHSQKIAWSRLCRAIYHALRYGQRVGLRPWELPAVVAICGVYYTLVALGGVMTHATPAAMGRRFRV